MKIAQNVLRRFVDVPADPRQLRMLLDDLGLEVKRFDPGASGPQGATYTLELLANRGDHHGYHGLAREIAGRTGAKVTLPRVTALEVGPCPVPLRVESKRCLVYALTLLERVDPSEDELPDERLAPLFAAGIHSVSPPVDATNLANLELGQPTHAFDADTIVGGVVVRESVAGETCLPLFAESRVTLPEGTLVIADHEKILAVAGVIGCEESKTTDATQRLLLESACFDPVAVRQAARALNVHTDSSARFERGSDPSAVLVGAGRVVALLEQDAGWRRAGPTGLDLGWVDPNRIIPLDLPAAATFLEYPLTEAQARARLERYGFTVSGPYPDWDPDDGWVVPPELEGLGRDKLRTTVLVRVPPHRLWDVEYPADLWEELAKSIGYNETPEHLPPIDMGAVPSPAEIALAKVDEVLRAAGFYEVFTDGFYGRDLLTRAGIGDEHPLAAHVQTLNALDRGYSLLKNNTLLQAVEAVAENLRMRTEQVRAYEWTRVFLPDPEASNGVCRERRLLWAITCGQDRDPSWADPGRPADPLFLKGLVEEIGTKLGLALAIVPGPSAHPLGSLLHPGRQASVVHDGRVVGILGEVHPRVVRGFKIKRARPAYLQLDQRALEQPGEPVPYVEPSELHPIVRNLAFTLPPRVAAGDIAAHLGASGPSWLSTVSMTDLFAHEQDGVPVRTVTYRLDFSSEGVPRTNEEVNQACDYLIRAVTARFGDQGVKLR